MEILLAIGGVAGLVWATVLFVRGGLFAGCLAVAFSGYLFGHAFFHLGDITLDRVMWAILVVQFVLCWRCGWLDRRPWGKPEFLLIAWFIWLTICTFSHDWQADGLSPLAQLLFFFTIPLGLYFAARDSSLSEKKVRVLLAVFAVLGIYLAVTSFAETRQWWWMVFPKHISSPANMDYMGRGRGPLLNASGNGILLTTCLCAGLMFWPRVGRFGKLLLVGFVALMAVGILCTYTRSVWLGAAAAVAIVMWFALPKRAGIAAIGSAVVGSALLLGFFGHQMLSFKRDVHATASDTRESLKLRPILAMVAWKMFQDHPLTGCGLGQYSQECRVHLGDRDTSFVLENARPYVQHNVILRLLTETGLPGTVMFVLVLLFWTTDAVKIWNNRDGPLWARQAALVFLGTLTAYLINGMFHDVSQIIMMNTHLMLWAGLTAGLRPWARNEPVVSRPATTVQPAVWGASNA